MSQYNANKYRYRRKRIFGSVSILLPSWLSCSLLLRLAITIGLTLQLWRFVASPPHRRERFDPNKAVHETPSRGNPNDLESTTQQRPSRDRRLWRTYSQWETRLSLYRATTYPLASQKEKEKRNVRYVAVLLQIGNPLLWEDMLMCAANVATAAAILSSSPDGSIVLDKHTQSNTVGHGDTFMVDYYVALRLEHQDILHTFKNTVDHALQQLPQVGNIHIQYFENRGADVLPFLRQLQYISEQQKRSGGHTFPTYDIVLKQHTKSDPIWRQRHVESLCGTPEQVISVWKMFQGEANQLVQMVAPQGTIFQRNTSPHHIFPHILQKYEDVPDFPAAAFDSETVSLVQETHETIFPEKESLPLKNMAIAAGSTFWIRYTALDVDHVVASLPHLEDKFTMGYVQNLALEHVFERLIPSEILLSGGVIRQIPPSPRVVALFFPQYHSFPENDRFWGEGFTEWTLLRPSTIEGIRKPLSTKDGGLGYYNLLDRNIRKRQADIARMAGLSGFVYYHYWFSGDHSPDDHLVMHKVQEALLLDGEPNMPFMLSWANEPWSKRWTGSSDQGEILLSQEYGDESEWEEHFRYLINFFLNPNYIRIEGKPVFIIYRLGHIPPTRLRLMIDLWRRMAVEEFDLPGLHIIHTLGNFYDKDERTRSQENAMDGVFHFWPQLRGSGFATEDEKSSTYNFDVDATLQYWGAYTGFDRRVRDVNAIPLHVSVNEFKASLEASFQVMAHSNRDIGLNLYFITAWNEWNEQAILEPDEKNGFSYLSTLQQSLGSIPGGDFERSEETYYSSVQQQSEENDTENAQ